MNRNQHSKSRITNIRSLKDGKVISGEGGYMRIILNVLLH
jgi:hypothetical protein